MSSVATTNPPPHGTSTSGGTRAGVTSATMGATGAAAPGTAVGKVGELGTIKERAHPRLALRMSAEVHAGGAIFTAVTRDLSEGGAGIEVSRPLVEGELITMGLFLVIDDVEEERMPPLWIKGRVIWAAERDLGGAAAGVRFEIITPQQQHWLRQILAHLGAEETHR